MREIISDNMYIIIFIPLWVSLLILLGRFFSVYINNKIIYILSLTSSALGAILSLLLFKIYAPDLIYENIIPFIKVNDFIIYCGIHIDKISLIFSSILFIVSFFVQLFSISYISKEEKKYRFYALLNLFNFSLAGLFFSPNLFQTYVFWEIAGIISYLLIGFEYNKHEKSLAAQKVFIINRIGDTAFLGAIITCSYLMYAYAPAKNLASLSFFDINTISVLLSAYSSDWLYVAICGLFITAAAVKSAQAPFYTWLQDAMEAKLPVSALLHSATLVALGGYLIIRLIPFFTLTDISLNTIAIIGIFTAILCSLCACSQNNAKKILAYSTSAQMGLMFFALGMLNITSAIYFFGAHAFTKSMLFLTLPDSKLKWNKIQFILFIIGGLSLSGIILAGNSAKELITSGLNTDFLLILAILSFLTGFYITRLAIIMFQGNGIENRMQNIFILISTFGLLIFNILMYVCFSGKITHNYTVLLSSTAGIIISGIIYLKHLNKPIPHLYSLLYNGFYLDKFYTSILAALYSKVANVSAVFDKNILGNYKLIKYFAQTSIKIFFWIEKNIMDKSVYLTTELFKKISILNLKIQNGNIQKYNLYAFIIITVVITALVITYTSITLKFKGVI